MTDQLNVDYGAMESTAGTLTTESQLLQLLLKDAKQAIDDLVEKGFRTEQASPQLHTSVTTMTTEIGQAVGALTNFADYLRKAAGAYRDADQELASALGGSGHTDKITINLPELDALKGNLKTALSHFQSTGSFAKGLDEDALGHKDLAETVGSFANDWDSEREDMIKSVDELATGYEKIVTSAVDIDKQLKSALNQGGTP